MDWTSLDSFYFWQIVYKQKHLLCDTFTSNLFLLFNVNSVKTFPTDFNTGDFLVSESLSYFLAKANYQFSSYVIASSPMFMLALLN